MIDIAENIKRVRDAISEAALKSGRSCADITLTAAAKTRSSDMIKRAIDAGVDAVGENRVQEMLEKHAEGAYNGAPLHFIGHLQSNKVKQIVGICDLIESVDSTSLIELISQRASARDIVQNILIEVNIGKEPQKSGVLPEETEKLLDFASKSAGVKVLGLMAVPPVDGLSDKDCNYFEAMFNLYVDMSTKKYDNVSMEFLSVGMSDSYAQAIQYGSNMVRIGTAIFGER